MSKLRRKREIAWRVFTWLGQHELGSLIALTILVAGVWAFAELADAVFEGGTHSFDRAVLLALRSPADTDNPIGPRWIQEMMRDFTALGGIAVLTVLTLASLGYLLLQRKTSAMCLVAVAVLGGMLMSLSLKSLFDRPRPDLAPHGSHVYSASFPSGHSMMAAVTYLTLAALLARVERRRSMKAYLLFVAVFLTLAAGISRVYLAVHWPTDVLAGWTLGACWAIACWLVARWLQRHDRLE